jgi:hypothetical protein
MLLWLENNAVVTWIRESNSLLGYTLHLALHTVGLVALVGPSLLIAARVLGLAPHMPIAPLGTYRPILKVGFWLTLITGSVLFATAPVSYVRNPVFLVKIAALVVALFTLRRLTRELFDRHADPDAHPISRAAKGWTVAMLAMWTIGVVAGRLTAYSSLVVVESLKAFGVVVLGAALLAALASLLMRRLSARRPPAFDVDIQAVPAKGGK